MALSMARWKAQGSGEQGWDWTRTRAFVAFGCGYTGAVQSVLFRSYERLFPAAPPAALPLSRLRPVLAKLCLNQFVVVPVLYFPLFFASTGLMRGSSAEQAYQAYSERWWPTCLANWGLWLPAQALQFGFVPLNARLGVFLAYSCPCDMKGLFRHQPALRDYCLKHGITSPMLIPCVGRHWHLGVSKDSTAVIPVGFTPSADRTVYTTELRYGPDWKAYSADDFAEFYEYDKSEKTTHWRWDQAEIVPRTAKEAQPRKVKAIWRPSGDQEKSPRLPWGRSVSGLASPPSASMRWIWGMFLSRAELNAIRDPSGDHRPRPSRGPWVNGRAAPRRVETIHRLVS